MKLRVVVAEKNSVARKIACSICKKPCEDRRSCENEHEDIFVHTLRTQPCLDSSRSLIPVDCVIKKRRKRNFKSPFYYQCDGTYCKHYPCHVDEQGRSNAIRMKRRIKDLHLEGYEKGFGVESVRYYELQDCYWRTIVLATNGTMLGINIRRGKNEPVAKKMKRTPNWDEMYKCIIYRPKEERNDKIHSYFCTNLLFKAILAGEYKGKIDQLIFATDYDIAGSYIALSILEKMQADRRNMRKDKLDESNVKRLVLKTLTKQEILHELNNPSSFDWGNAYGGKLKSAFDFFFGIPLTNILRRAILKSMKELFPKESRFPPLSIGRVQLPALFLIINRDWEAAINKEMHNIYIVFRGYFSIADILDSVKKRELIAFLTKERRTHYSKSQFLLDLAENKIGTHTTRLKLPISLEKSKLIEINENQRICSTTLGLQYFNILRSRLRTEQIDFASVEFNKKFHEDIDTLKNLDQDSKGEGKNRHECEQRFNNLMKFYYENIRELIPKFQVEARKIAPLLAKIINETKKKKDEQVTDKSRDSSMDLPLELKADDNIPLDYLNILVDDLGRYKEPELEEALLYRRKRQKIDLLNLLRLLLRVPRDMNFTICGMYQEEYTTEFNEDNCVVFKAMIPNGHTSDCVKRFKYILDNLDSLQFEPPITELTVKKKVELAHEPLHTVNLQYRNIPGEDGKKLVREYDRPYIYTIRKLLALGREEGGLICGFSIKGLRFQSIDPYEPFEAHNYESMLFTMHEKYEWDLRCTADMMQKLYEGGEFY